MPKDTFHRLKDEKKQRIFQAAVQEFSSHSFSEASLNRIVKAANIPWGSFYQYFHDKDDLFSYLIERIMMEIETLEQKNLPGCDDCSALAQFANRLASTIELNNAVPEYVQIAMVNAKETAYSVKKYFGLSDEHKQAVVSLFERDKQRGLIREDVDVIAIIEMVYILSKEVFYAIGSDGEAYLKKIESFLDIINNGIRRDGIL